MLGSDAAGVDIDTLDLTDRAAVLKKLPPSRRGQSFTARPTRRSIRPRQTPTAAGR